MAMTLITTNTSSGVTTSNFTASIDSTYKLFIFKVYDLNPETDATYFQFNGSIDAGSNYNVTKTTTVFNAYNNEADDAREFTYWAGIDVAQGTGYAALIGALGSEADQNSAGTLWLFNPSDTTYIKHFYATFNASAEPDASYANYTSGYFNTTDNIDAISFNMSSGDFDAVIKMYGVG